MYVYLSICCKCFSKGDKGGNKAGVVLFNNELNDEQKREIAKKLGYAETAFITSSDKADFNIEYFTPKEEVPLCGHATIATFTILKYLNKINKENYTIETKSGIFEIIVKNGIIFMEQKNPIFYDEIIIDELKDCFDIECIETTIPIQIGSTGLRDILIPIKSEKLLSGLNPNFESIVEISKKYNVIGTHLYTFENNRMICRNFAPLYDINEEAATGTSNCALAGFLYEKMNMKKKLFIFEQGYNLNSVSEILVKIVDAGNEIKQIYVGGNGYFCKIINMEI